MRNLLALAAAAFCYVATETMPVGILTPISADPGVPPQAVGLLITGYAVTVAVVTIPLTYVTRNVPRRRLMIVLLAVLVLADLLSAVALLALAALALFLAEPLLTRRTPEVIRR